MSFVSWFLVVFGLWLLGIIPAVLFFLRIDKEENSFTRGEKVFFGIVWPGVLAAFLVAILVMVVIVFLGERLDAIREARWEKKPFLVVDLLERFPVYGITVINLAPPLPDEVREEIAKAVGLSSADEVVTQLSWNETFDKKVIPLRRVIDHLETNAYDDNVRKIVVRRGRSLLGKVVFRLEADPAIGATVRFRLDAKGEPGFATAREERDFFLGKIRTDRGQT